jgi:hypothetical protein
MRRGSYLSYLYRITSYIVKLYFTLMSPIELVAIGSIVITSKIDRTNLAAYGILANNQLMTMPSTAPAMTWTGVCPNNSFSFSSLNL